MNSTTEFEAYMRSVQNDNELKSKFTNTILNSFYTSTSTPAPHEELEKGSFISTVTGNKTKKLTDVEWKDIKLIGDKNASTIKEK